MINIEHSDHCITVTGHAGYAPIGQDIVCAGVSALVTAFVASVERLTVDEIQADMTAGHAVIRYGNLSASAQLLLGSFLVGVRMIADDYPDNVKVVHGAGVDHLTKKATDKTGKRKP